MFCSSPIIHHSRCFVDARYPLAERNVTDDSGFNDDGYPINAQGEVLSKEHKREECESFLDALHPQQVLTTRRRLFLVPVQVVWVPWSTTRVHLDRLGSVSVLSLNLLVHEEKEGWIYKWAS